MTQAPARWVGTGLGVITRLRTWLGPTATYRRHALVSSLTSVGLYGLGLVSGPIFARVLGPTGRGDIAAVMAPATVLVWVLGFGLPSAAAYFVDTVPEARLLATVTAFGVVVGAPICAALWLLAPEYLSGHSPVALHWARVFLVAMPLSVGMAAALEIRRRMDPGMSWNCWRSAPLVIPTFLTVVLAATGNLTLQTALAANFVGWMSPLLLLLSRFRGGRRARPSSGTLRLIFPYAWRTASALTATSLTYRLDQVILVTLVPPAELGLYAVAVMVALVTSPLSSGLSVALFGHLRDETSESRALARFHRSLKLTLMVSAAVAMVLAVSAPWLLRLVFGTRFAPATTALRLLLPGAVAFDLLGVITTKLFSDGRPGEASRAAFVGATMTVVGLVLLAPRHGIEGAAVVTSAAWLSQVAFLVARGALRSPPGPDRSAPYPPPAATPVGEPQL